MLSKTTAIPCCIVLAACLACAGCEGVDFVREDRSLELLFLSPSNLEKGVPPDVDVVAVFSDGMTTGEGDENLNERTFFVQEEGETLDSVVELSDLDPENATAIIRLWDLEAGGEYTVVVKGTVKGTDTTDPLGIDVQNTFTVAD